MPDNRKPLKYGAFPVCRNYTVRAHFCHAIPKKRSGCQDTVQHPWSLLSRIYPQYLHPCYGGNETGGGGNHWRRDQRSYVVSIKMQKKFSTKSLQNETEPQLKTAPDREQPARRRYVPSDFFAVWVTIWVNPKSKRMDIIFSPQRKRKVPDFLRNQELFGGDYWTRTSDLLRVKQAL